MGAKVKTEAERRQEETKRIVGDFLERFMLHDHYGSESEVMDNMTEHMMVFCEALEIYEERTVKYGQAWRRRGWLGNIMNLFNCVDRLDGFWWRKDTPDPMIRESVDQALDDAFDAINYLIFFIRNVRARNRSGI